MFSAIDLFFILLTAVLLMAAISLTVAFYSAAPQYPDETLEEMKPAGEDLVSSLPDAHMTTWHIGNHLADRLPPRSVSENIEQLPFTQTYHLLGDTDLEESQEHPTFNPHRRQDHREDQPADPGDGSSTAPVRQPRAYGE